MNTPPSQQIIVKKIRRIEGGHHGGSWKVALADLMTAMMAFFLVMWLINSTSAAQKQAISEYFSHQVIGEGGSTDNLIANTGHSDKTSVIELDHPSPTTPTNEDEKDEKDDLKKMKDELENKLHTDPNLKPYRDQVRMEIIPEGLRILILDKEKRPMFGLGSNQLKPYTLTILKKIAATINNKPNQLSISGHTDAKRYLNSKYSNWELSADRANAARRAMLAGGLSPRKISRVIGAADSTPLDAKNRKNPINRRISIVVLTTQAAKRTRNRD